MEILKDINWVDLFALAIAVRIFYVSAKTGFAVEFFKLLAALVALFVCFHYYVKVGGMIEGIGILPAILGTTAFIVLWLLTLLICKFIRDGLFMVFTVQAQNTVDKWGAMILAVARVAITISMVMFVLLATEQKYLQGMVLTSLSGRHIVGISPDVYQASCDHFVTPLFPGEKKNPAVAQVLKDVVKK